MTRRAFRFAYKCALSKSKNSLAITRSENENVVIYQYKKIAIIVRDPYNIIKNIALEYYILKKIR